MQPLKFLKILICLSIALFVMQDAALAKPADDEITIAIKDKISKDSSVSGLIIEVTTNNNVVTLSGDTHSDTQASKLVQIAQSEKGVKNVVSKLDIKEGKDFLADAQITAKVKGLFIREKLFDKAELDIWGVKVETDNGVVHLSGTAKTQQEIDNAIAIAKKVDGVKSVDSKIEIK